MIQSSFTFAQEDTDESNIREEQAYTLGTSAYTITFPAGEEPPVDAFWSITMYDYPDGFLIENPIDRYSIGTYNDMERDKDGNLTIYIQYDSPGKKLENNWLPAPNEPFYLCLRLYNARSEALNFDWVPPAVKKMK